MTKINPNLVQQQEVTKIEKDPFDIDVRELKTSSLKNEQQEEIGTTITTITAPIISITKYSLLLKC